MSSTESKNFHFVMSTVGRPDDLRNFLESLHGQEVTYHLTLIEQANQPHSKGILTEYVPEDDYTYFFEPKIRGLSRGRNVGVATLRGDVIAFPDDDCRYTPGLLKGVLTEFESIGADIIGGMQLTNLGAPSMLRWKPVSGWVTPRSVPRTVNSSTLFIRRNSVQEAEPFDVHLGAGSGTPFGAGEENDYVLQLLRSGRRMWYAPHLRVLQTDWRESLPAAEVLAKAESYNRGFGRVLRKHGRVGDFLYWSGRSLVGALVALARRDSANARQQGVQLRGRVQGFFAKDR